MFNSSNNLRSVLLSETQRNSGADPELWTAIVSTVSALILASLFVFGREDFCLDDAWIHLTYANNLRELGEFSYNAGDWETGFSSPLWVIALTIWPMGENIVVSTKLLGTLFHGVTAWMATLLALEYAKQLAHHKRPLPRASIGLASGILVATNPTLLQGATSGMEVSLCAALLLAAIFLHTKNQFNYAGVVAGMAAWARPESLALFCSFTCILAFHHRNWSSLKSLIGPAIAMGIWMGYCQVVSGYPLPNTFYVKVNSNWEVGLQYLRNSVLPWEPWLVSLGGFALFVAALLRSMENRNFALPALAMAWIIAMISVAGSRPFHEGVLFYESRYFAIFAGFPPILVGVGLAKMQKRWTIVCLITIAIVTGMQIDEIFHMQRAQERSIQRVHTEPAQFLSGNLPSHAIVAVEGAGAFRYFAPASMTIVDIMGLNDKTIAHVRSENERACELLSRPISHFALPEHIAGPLSKVITLIPVATFEDPNYAQVEPAHRFSLSVYKAGPVNPKWKLNCQAHYKRD